MLNRPGDTWRIITRRSRVDTPTRCEATQALAATIGVVLLWNYFVNRKRTFGDVE